MTASRRRARAGYTLVELLIAIMILGIIATAMTRLMVTQANFTSSQATLRGARSVSRDAYNILMTNLRMVQRDDPFGTYEVDFEVTDLAHLTRIVAALRASDAVAQAERI